MGRLVCAPALACRLAATMAALGGERQLLAEGRHPLVVTKVVCIVGMRLGLERMGLKDG